MTAAGGGRLDERLRQAGLHLFSTQGYTGTGIRDIARAAGLSTSTLYHHLKTKEDLLVAIMREAFLEISAATTAAMARFERTDERIGALVFAHITYETASPSTAIVVDNELRFLHGSARRRVMPLRDRYGALWQTAIEAAIADGTVGIADARMARLALTETCSAPGRWYSPDGELSPAQIAQAFVGFSLSLLRSAHEPDEIAVRVAAELAGPPTRP